MLQFPKTTSATLPSYETINIVKDPPKSIVVPRKTYVDIDNVLKEMTEEGLERISETIMESPRGLNPMLGVQYSSKMPYSVVRDGVFRPEVFAPRDLVPLSRQSKPSGSYMSTPSFADAMKSIEYEPDKKAYRQTPLRASVAPCAVFKYGALNPSHITDQGAVRSEVFTGSIPSFPTSTSTWKPVVDNPELSITPERSVPTHSASTIPTKIVGMRTMLADVPVLVSKTPHHSIETMPASYSRPIQQFFVERPGLERKPHRLSREGVDIAPSYPLVHS